MQIGCQDITTWRGRINHIKGMDIQVDTIQAIMEIPECISVAEIWQASSTDNHLQQLKGIISTGWPDSRDELHADLQPYWSYRDELAVIDGIILKGKCIIIPNSLKEQVLNQLHINHMDIEKTKLLAREFVYWPSINADIEKYIKLHNMSSISANAALGKNNSSQYTPLTMGNSLG